MQDPKFREAVDRDSKQVKAVTNADGSNRCRLQKELAEVLGVSPSAVSRWHNRGRTVQDSEGFYLIKETIDRVKETYGYEPGAPLKVTRKNSHWHKHPHCVTHRAREIYQGFLDEKNKSKSD